MTADPDGSGDSAANAAAVAESAPDPATGDDASSPAVAADPVEDTAVEDAAATDPAGEETTAEDSAQDMKAKFREALAHKHGSHGATHTEHGDRGAPAHGPEQAHAHRMFRRKSG